MKCNWKQWIRRGLAYVIVAALSSALTFYFFVPGQQGKLNQLQSVISSYFVGEYDEQAALDGAAEGMVAALGDRWSYYISADDYDDYLENTNNAYVGVGITISQNNNAQGFKVLLLEHDGPAHKAGMKAGDVIVEAQGQDVTGITSSELQTLIQGKEGTQVTIAVLRGEQKLSFTMERAQITSVVARGEMLEGNIGLVTIRNFNSRCAEESIAAIETLLEEGATALIFDVRNNGGGYRKELVELLDYLLPEGDLFKSVYYDGETETDTSDEKCLKMPMAVLVNGRSYSAAEFFAAALQEYDWATVVGQQTVGKGYFQNTIRLSDGSAVALSVGKYFTPKGISLAEAGGLTPDIPVEVDEETDSSIYSRILAPKDDPQILAAVECLAGK